MKKQTAVEWFWNEIAEVLPFTVDSITAIKMYDKLQQAKSTEREQIIDAYLQGSFNWQRQGATQFYNETYKGGEQ
jgi:hypothetical protein